MNTFYVDKLDKKLNQLQKHVWITKSQKCQKKLQHIMKIMDPIQDLHLLLDGLLHPNLHHMEIKAIS